MSSIWRTIFVSIGLHALFLGIWGILPPGATFHPEDPQVISIALVEQTESPSVELPGAVPPIPPTQVEQTAARSPMPVQAQPSQAQPSQAQPSDVEPSVKLPDAVAFIEMSRTFANGRRPEGSSRASGVLDFPTMIYEADLRADSPNVTRTGVRATPESRFLRDTTPDSDRQGRSKVQLAGNAGPDYPRSAREAGWEGTVMLRVEVLPNGSAGQVNLRKSSGYSVLDEAALSAVQQWRFVPALDGHFPVRSLVDLPIRFDLMDSLP